MKPTVKQIGIILLVSGVVSFLANSVHPRKIPWVQDWSNNVEAKAKAQKIKVIPLSVALDKIQASDSVFVDARPAGDYSQGHIRGALSIPVQSLEEQFELIGHLIDSGKQIIIYCQNRDCDDSLILATELKAMGASNLLLYIDGFDLWQEHGGAVEASE